MNIKKLSALLFSLAIFVSLLFATTSIYYESNERHFFHSRIRKETKNYLYEKNSSPSNPLKNTDVIGVEGTPIEFHGALFAVISTRSWAGSAQETGILINNLTTRKIVTQFNIPDFGFISAVVHNDVIYVFGTSDWSKSNQIRMISSSDLIHWSQPETVMRSQKEQVIFNTSVTKGAEGFVMAYEVSEPSVSGFTSRFARSNDLINWESTGTIFNRDEYSACPTLRYNNGYYFITYLVHRDNRFYPVLARSNDLSTWDYSNTPLFLPSQSEGNNNSDIDFVEKDGKVYILYFTGDQSTWGG